MWKLGRNQRRHFSDAVKSILEHESFRQSKPTKIKRKKPKNNRVLPTRKAFSPPLHDETLVVLSNGATYQTSIGHPAFTPGKVVLQTDVMNTLNWVTPKVLKQKREYALKLAEETMAKSK